VKKRCLEAGIPVYAPAFLKDVEAGRKMEELKPEIFVVASYGKLIPESWLRIPTKAALNLHPSLLPKYRGAAPINWQIVNGEPETGVSVAELTRDLDAGDLFCQRREPLEETETAASLTKKLAGLAVKTLEETLSKLEKGTANRTPQKHSESSYARKLAKEDGFLDLSKSAEELGRKIRGFHPWPGAYIDYQGKPLRIVEATCDSIACSEAASGILLEVGREGYLRIQTGKGSLKLLKVQLPGRRIISGRDFANGERLAPGFLFRNLS